MIKLLCFRPCGTGVVHVQRGQWRNQNTDGGMLGNSIYNRGGAANSGKIEDTINNVRKLATWKGELLCLTQKGQSKTLKTAKEIKLYNNWKKVEVSL